ncbi:MAG: TatD family hydrolase [Treponema sp.]|nr:TatD family hydrolase [Treponema sp.]
MTYCDSHFHLVQSASYESLDSFAGAFDQQGFRGCTCSHSEEEFLRQEALLLEFGGRLGLKGAFGLHPQNPDLSLAPFLENLLREKRIDAVGESGFDFFTPEFRSDRFRQDEAWHISLELSASYGLPVVIHDRKALDLIFRDAALLKKVPAALFHSFAFGPREALAILNHGINAYFSFGKALLNGNKKSIACVAELPLERLLFETDAPYQTLKGEDFTPLGDIRLVYQKASELRACPLEEVCSLAERNFSLVFDRQ